MTVKNDKGAEALAEESLGKASAAATGLSTRRDFFVFVATIVLLVVFCMASVVSWQDLQQLRQKQEEELTNLIERVEEADKTLSSLDGLIADCMAVSLDQIDRESFSKQKTDMDQQLEELTDKQKTVQETLNDIVAETKKEIFSTVLTKKDGRSERSSEDEAYAYVGAATEAQESIAEYGSRLLESIASATSAVDLADVAWEELYKADNAARQAASLAFEASNENMQSSMEFSNSAIEGFEQALRSVDRLIDGYNIEAEAYLDYLDLRIEAQQYALVSDQAYLDKDKNTLIDANVSCNNAEIQAAELMKEQEGTLYDLVAQWFLKSSEEDYAAYRDAWDEEDEAIAFLQDYVKGLDK